MRRIAVFFLVLILPILAALTACGAVLVIVSPATPTPSATDYISYTVRAGETLAQIATRFHSTIEELITLNSDRYRELARDPSVLQPGWQLRVPTRNLSPSARATAEAAAPQIDLSEAARSTVDQLNAARAQRGAGLLRTDGALTRIASDRSADMIARDYFSHDDPQTGQEPLLRYLQAYGYPYQYAGENIAEIKNGPGFVPPWLTVAARYSPIELADEFVKDWLNSPEHRANIFNRNYRRTGVALAVSRDGHRIVATQAFSD
ncbi:MAG: LysM peptidoglycan-binding domain-containing protein [Chloroflexota bacterium]|nr:LysM peptidoglycan-binding domain-containing protein [Chloroflexota bacterium]